MTIMQTSIVKQRGSVMLESLIAILIFSMGILALVALLGASVKNTASAKYRTEASLFANQVIGEMWTGNRTNASLVADYGTDSGDKYEVWKDRVVQTLPGVADASLPTITVAADNTVTVTVYWQAPGETDQHKYVAVTRIQD
jgi:type IV pilus assembly protein PilV